MTTGKPAPRHRKARRPMAPVFDLADTLTALKTPLRGTAAASAAGLALTAVVGGTATAAPTVHDAAVDTSNNTATVLPTTKFPLRLKLRLLLQRRILLRVITLVRI